MSAMGQKQTSRHAPVMSVLPLKADIRQRRYPRAIAPKAQDCSLTSDEIGTIRIDWGARKAILMERVSDDQYRA
jgi:hypothetical protein